MIAFISSDFHEVWKRKNSGHLGADGQFVKENSVSSLLQLLDYL